MTRATVTCSWRGSRKVSPAGVPNAGWRRSASRGPRRKRRSKPFTSGWGAAVASGGGSRNSWGACARGGKETGTGATRFGDWAREPLRQAAGRFFDSVPVDQADESALHQLRIRGKELRYRMELLAAAFPCPLLRTRLYPTVEALQDQLGEVNDLATAKARLRQKIAVAKNAAEEAPWRRLLRGEKVRLNQARQAFWQWCSPRLIQELRDGFAELLRDAPPNGQPLPPGYAGSGTEMAFLAGLPHRKCGASVSGRHGGRG